MPNTMSLSNTEKRSAIAVLVSGGMDSSILLVDLAKTGCRVYPVYLEHGLYWESVELQHLKSFLAEIDNTNIERLTVLKQPVDDLYDEHWSMTGKNVPDEFTEDDAVYLPGRNLLLLAKVGVWCSLNKISKLALAPLKGNPFSDNSDEFYSSMEQSLKIALGSAVKVIRPFSTKSKDEVIALGGDLPLSLTFSCIKPIDGLHCGTCNKCAERIQAYTKLGQQDQTEYFSFTGTPQELDSNV